MICEASEKQITEVVCSESLAPDCVHYKSDEVLQLLCCVIRHIYIYIKMFFWSRTSSKTFNCYSEFHASNEAIIRPDDCFIRSMKLRVAIKCF